MKYLSHPTDGLSVYVGLDYYHVSKGHRNWLELLECIRSNDEARFVELIDDKRVLNNLVAKGVELRDDVVYYNGQAVHSVLTDRILELVRLGLEVDPMLKFLDNLMQNPSKASVDELYSFLENKHLPITDDGHFLAYKAVKSNYMDKYSGTVRNMIGDKPTMERNMVDDNRNNHCSQGYHVGAIEYSGPEGWYFGQGDHCMVVKVNPKDAVSVPTDHNCQKLRVCSYEVVDEFTKKMVAPVYCGTTPIEYDEPEEDDSEVLPEELLDGDEVKFEYNGKERHGWVESCSFSTITLHEDDDEDEDVYKSYKISNIRNLRLLS